MSIKFVGDKQLKRNLDTLRGVKGPKVYTKILLNTIVDLENTSAKKTPVDTGNLKKSGLGNQKGKNGILWSNSDGAAAYTANTAEYAVYVHERTELKHTVGEAKFLENALKEVAPRIERKFGVELKTEMFSKDMK